MASHDGSSNAAMRAAIKDLLQARTKVAERLAGQLDRYDAACEAVASAGRAAVDEAARAREVYQEALDAGWTAAELVSAGLKPPATPRRRSGGEPGTPAPAVR